MNGAQETTQLSNFVLVEWAAHKKRLTTIYMIFKMERTINTQWYNWLGPKQWHLFSWLYHFGTEWADGWNIQSNCRKQTAHTTTARHWTCKTHTPRIPNHTLTLAQLVSRNKKPDKTKNISRWMEKLVREHHDEWNMCFFPRWHAKKVSCAGLHVYADCVCVCSRMCLRNCQNQPTSIQTNAFKMCAPKTLLSFDL